MYAELRTQRRLCNVWLIIKTQVPQRWRGMRWVDGLSYSLESLTVTCWPNSPQPSCVAKQVTFHFCTPGLFLLIAIMEWSAECLVCRPSVFLLQQHTCTTEHHKGNSHYPRHQVLAENFELFWIWCCCLNFGEMTWDCVFKSWVWRKRFKMLHMEAMVLYGVNQRKK